MTIKTYVSLAVSLLALASGSAARGQTHLGQIRGRVTDPSGAAVVDAPYRLVNESTNELRQGTSAGDGSFAVIQLQPDAYRLEIEFSGYKTSLSRATLGVDQQLRLDVQLELGAVSEQVEVSAPHALDRAATGLGTVVDTHQIETLPLDGRNFLDLVLLVPGAAPAAKGAAATGRGDFAFTASGGRDQVNSYLLDGAYNVDLKLNTPVVQPPVDAIAEFKVLTSGYDAAFGRHAGAQVNVITRSGGNRFNGTAYGFFRTAAMNGSNAFAPKNEPDPEYTRSQYGFSLGGPLGQDRTFFFVDYEGTRLSEGITRVTNVPTLAERNGDFSNSLGPVPINPFTGQPFPGNQIPDFFIHPTGQALADLYPEPNRDVPFQNYVASPLLDDDRDQFDIKVDHTLTTNSRMSVRYSMGDRRLFEPYGGPGFATVPGYGNDVPRRGQNLLGSHTHVVSPTMVNDLRVVYNRVSSSAFQENLGTSLNSLVGLPDLSDDPRTWGLSQINVTGYGTLGDEFNNPQDSTLSTLQVSDAMTWTRGAHLVKLGADLRFTRQDAFRDVQSRGFYNFANQGITGNAMADLLLGLPITTGGATLDNPQQLRARSYNLFISDSYQLSSNLTLSAGLRYEVNAPPVDADDRANVYDPATGQLVQVGTSGVPRGGYETDWNNFAPRVGVAWTPDTAGQTVVRGGYGIYYDHSALASGEGLYFNAPYFDFNLFFPLPGSLLTLSDPFPSTFPFPTPPSALTYQRDLRTPYLQQWNIGVQRELGTGRTVEVAYVGSKGHDLIRGRDINQPAPSPIFPNVRPNPFFSDIVQVESQARSRYDSLQLRFQQRLQRGLTILSSYTLGDSKDDASGFFKSSGDPNFPQNHNAPEAEYGRSGFDSRHRFSLSFSYELPLGPGRRHAASGWAAQVFGDWQVAGIVSLQTGQPFTVAFLPVVDNSNTGRGALGFGFNDRPNLTGDPSLSNPSANAWFNTGAFTAPPYGSFGDAGRNILEGPAFKTFNFALHKQVRLGEDMRLQLRLEAFNLFNHVNLGLPDHFFGSPTFGRITSAGDARRLQLGFKLLF